jgi:hypothetical protein
VLGKVCEMAFSWKTRSRSAVSEGTVGEMVVAETSVHNIIAVSDIFLKRGIIIS